MKNTDNKTAALVANFCVSPVVQNAACDLQNGFVAERQLVQNPVGLDWHARMSALEYGASNDAKPGFYSNTFCSSQGD